MRTRAILILVLTALAAPARAQTEPPTVEIVEFPPPPWTFEVAPSFGLIVPTSKLGTNVAGSLELGWALPVAQRRLVLALDGSIARPSHSGSGTDTRVGGDYDYKVAVTEFEVGLGLRFRFFPADHKLVPYVGAGAALHMLRTTETSSLAPGDNTEQGTKVGFAALGGVDYRLGPGLLLGELRITYAKLDHKWTGDSNDGNVTIAVGYRFVF